MDWHYYVLILVAGSISAFTTGIGAVPLFYLGDISDELNVGLYGLAAGLMTGASIFGLLFEAWKENAGTWIVVGGLVVGAVLVVVAHEAIERFEWTPRDIAQGDFRTMASVFLVLLVHSFPEGIAVGVSFANLATTEGVLLLGFSIPILAIAMTLTIAVQNMPEGVAVAVPLVDESEISNSQTFWAAVFTSLPQPIGALVAFYFVQTARHLLGAGYGFAAGAMLFLVATDLVPEGLEAGEDLPNPKTYMVGGFAAGVLVMAPLLLLL